MSHQNARILACISTLRETALECPKPPTLRQRMFAAIKAMRSTSKAMRKAKVYRRVEIDWESYIRRSELDKTPRMPPLTAARVFTDYFNRPGYAKHRDCGRCDRDWQAPKTVTSIRPPGTLSRWSCHGCAVSFLDDLGEEIEAIQDRLYAEWIEAREQYKDHHAARKYQITEKAKRKWRARRDLLKDRISEAKLASQMAGADPEKRLRRKTLFANSFPEPRPDNVYPQEELRVEMHDHLAYKKL